MKNVAIVGANGKMGKLLFENIKDKYNVIKITENNTLSDYKNIDLVVDFACALSSVISASFCAKNKIPILIASTGQSKSDLKKIEKYSLQTPIMVSSNLSIGIFFVKKIIDSIIDLYDYDITIYEKHHREKKDKPSGTAKMLYDYIISKKEHKIDILSQRGGREIGTHEISFYFDDELISIKHTAFSRMAFIKGAILAIDYLINQKQPKLYYFEDLI